MEDYSDEQLMEFYRNGNLHIHEDGISVVDHERDLYTHYNIDSDISSRCRSMIREEKINELLND